MRADAYRLRDREQSEEGATRRQGLPRELGARSLRAAFDTHRKAIQVGNMERDQAFSWQYCFISLFSYGLMLSDVFRTGFGIKSLNKYQTLEPDTYVYFGPYAYRTQHLTTENATSDATAYWPYKYDTTSIPMRAVAQHLNLHAWSPCVRYEETCDETTSLTRADVFHMMEALVEGVSTHPRGAMTLRSDVEYKDRVYHYALPWFFNHSIKRTTQAIHYTYNPSQSPPVPPLCGGTKPARRPYSCLQSWTNLGRLKCGRTGTCPPGSTTVWKMIPKHAATLAAAYPNHTLDFVVFDGMEDFMRSGLAYQGRKYYEIVVYSRIRQCDDTGGCRTVAVDDYRYEAATFIMTAPSWFAVVALLRGLGQFYAWSRLLLLIAGAYAARMREHRFQDATVLARLIITARTVFLIPSQVVIYGSSFPVTMYMLAHLIDSAAEYELAFAYFMSALGEMHWNLTELIRHCAISMRSVWIVGFMCHRIVALTTSSSWSPIHGVPGSSEFSITFIASITVFAQVRSVNFRNTKILETQEVIPSAVRYPRLAEIQDMTHMAVNKLVGGTTVDAQCLLTGCLGLFCISVLIWALHRIAPRYLPLHLTLTSTTIAPYSAGTLWPRNCLVVTWYGNVLNMETSERSAGLVRAATAQPDSERNSTHARMAAIESFKHAQRLYKQFVSLPDKALVLTESSTSQLLQRSMYSVDKRTREIESTVFLINLVAMTDPATFYALRVSAGRFVALYVSRVSRRCFLLPFGLVVSDADIPIEWADQELVAVVNTKELEWQDLLRCG